MDIIGNIKINVNNTHHFKKYIINKLNSLG